MAAWNVGKKNGLWKGGRSVASNGYVLIRVGVDHPLADVRGYAYEHRLVAEQKLGRSLLPGELVHHINGNKADNDPDNLKVVESTAHHFVYHRRSGKALRMPSEPNVRIECGCGCGETFDKYDLAGRPRRYVSGHNPPLSSPTTDKILRLLSDSAMRRSDLALHFDSEQALAVALSKLKKKGLVTNVRHGVWEIVKSDGGW